MIYFRNKEKGNTVGGQIKCHVKGVPLGIGEPVFDKLHADLGKAMLSINAVKGFEYGSGLKVLKCWVLTIMMNLNQLMEKYLQKLIFHGGIQGGLSNGEEIYFKVAFKPVQLFLLIKIVLIKKKTI